MEWLRSHFMKKKIQQYFIERYNNSIPRRNIELAFGQKGLSAVDDLVKDGWLRKRKLANELDESYKIAPHNAKGLEIDPYFKLQNRKVPRLLDGSMLRGEDINFFIERMFQEINDKEQAVEDRIKKVSAEQLKNQIGLLAIFTGVIGFIFSSAVGNASTNSTDDITGLIIQGIALLIVFPLAIILFLRLIK